MPKDIENKIKSNSDTISLNIESNGDKYPPIVSEDTNGLELFKESTVESKSFFVRTGGEFTVPIGHIGLLNSIFGVVNVLEPRTYKNYVIVCSRFDAEGLEDGMVVATVHIVKTENISA